MSSYAADLSDIRTAAARIAPYAHRTPILTSSAIDDMAGRELFFKCENLQKIGAFKFRGALNAVLSLSTETAARGVVTHSSGNHAQAVALAAQMRGIPATIVMPSSSPAVKQRAVAGYGARILLCEPTLAAREIDAAKVIAETGATLIHAYNEPKVIAGQGTVALEILDQVPDLDTLVTPVGGGGLLSGMAIAAKALQPSIQVYAGEPMGADDAARSKAAGQLIPQTGPNTIADGLLTSLGSNTWPVVRDLVDGIIVVEDEQIRAAMRLIWERMKLVVEPSAAVGLAAVLSGQIPGTRMALVLTGGNLDLDPMFR
jgi:threonine dehydratase